MKKLFSIILPMVGLLFFAVPSLAAASVVYDALPNVVPLTSYPSQPFQAQATTEFGDSIHLGGSNRILNNVTVTMVTWARFSEYLSNPAYQGNSTSWTYPITLNVYSTSLDSNGIPNQLLGTVTQDITIPWRPENDPSTCTDGFKWLDGFGKCVNGLAFNAVFDLSSLHVTLPDDVIVTVAYNTQTWGLKPTGVNGPYNSLNVAVPANQKVTVGSDTNTDAVFWNSTYNGRSAGLKLDSGWTPNGTVALQVTANAPVLPDSQQASFYKVNQCSSDNVSNDPYQGHVTLITPDGKNDLMLQGVIKGLASNVEYTVWVRNLTGFKGENIINNYSPLGYFALTSFMTDKKGTGNFSYKINKADLPAETYPIQVALNTGTKPFPSQDYGCTMAATSINFLKVYVGQ